MALTATEEALIRELLDQQAAILSLASAESTIISKLGATKVTLAELVAASGVADADLLLTRQGTTDKSVRADILAGYMGAELGTLFAPIDSPALTGTPTAPTAAAGTNTNQIATTEFVQTATNTRPSITGSATLNGTTGNTVQLSGIVTTLGLEVGDVIRIQYSGYDKLHTVEYIGDDNDQVVVNTEHAGNRGNGSLRLPDTTAIMTVTRIAKWYNAPIGLGQAWVNVKNFRALNTTYTNTTGRSITIAMMVAGPSAGARIRVDGAEISHNDLMAEGGTMTAYCSVPNGSKYVLSNYDGTYAATNEMR